MPMASKCCGIMRLIRDHPHLGDDGGASVPIALLPKPPRDAAGNVATSLPGRPEPWCAA